LSVKVLISAYACEPGKGSEPYAGWSWVNAIARVADEVHVITRANNRPAIEAALAERPVRNLFFHYFDLPRWVRFWKRGQRGVQLYYYLWQYGLRVYAARLHSRHGFDIAHHVTMAGMQYPPGLAALSIPFIWGPIGAVRVPPALKDGLHWRARVSEAAHDAAFVVARRDPLVRRAFLTARLVLVFPGSFLLHPPAGNVLRTGNIFVDLSGFPTRRRPAARGDPSLHVVSAFRMIFWKGGDLGIEAVARLKARGVRVRYTLVGDGPERRRWQALARHLGLADVVEFPGWLSRDATLAVLREGDVLLHPAYREGWSGTVLEGMALGLPVVCLDWGEPGHIVDDESGVKVPVNESREAVVEGLADALERLQDFSVRCTMGVAARERVRQHFSMEALHTLVESVYKEATGW
jgi:glycosyltransferase involved in cell wall biosynthesis